MRAISIALPDEAADKLGVLAARDFRGPRQQAAHLLVSAIEREARRPETRRRPAQERAP